MGIVGEKLACIIGSNKSESDKIWASCLVNWFMKLISQLGRSELIDRTEIFSKLVITIVCNELITSTVCKWYNGSCSLREGKQFRFTCSLASSPEFPCAIKRSKLTSINLFVSSWVKDYLRYFCSTDIPEQLIFVAAKLLTRKK